MAKRASKTFLLEATCTVAPTVYMGITRNHLPEGITQKMVNAGVDCLHQWDLEYDSHEQAVASVFLAMKGAQNG